jgi:hypothetical protein
VARVVRLLAAAVLCPVLLVIACSGGGFDLDSWRSGGWKDWDKGEWLREAGQFVNPVIDGLWNPDRMRRAKDPTKMLSQEPNAGLSDPVPAPVPAEAESVPYQNSAAPVGKVFFDGPQGSMVCSGTLVRDPRNPGRSNLVWTAGHCVHAGKDGGWYRNIAFVPAFNDLGSSPAELGAAPQREVAPFGMYWADWAETSPEWISQGTASGGGGAPYDYAVLHVKPQNGGASLEETVGGALPVDFSAPSATDVPAMGAWGYPAAAPFDGVIMHRCLDRPGRLSLASDQPTMYRIGCTMTGGGSGGGWFRETSEGGPALVSNTSIGPPTSGWLAGPSLGSGARKVYDAVSVRFASE